MKNKHNKLNFKKQNGSLLTEMLVGLAISSMTILLVTTISIAFDKQKKITTSVSQAVASNALTAFPLQTIGKNVGFGFNDRLFLGCTVNAFNSSNGAHNVFTLRPAFIETNVDGDELKDKITVTYGNASNYYTELQLTAPMSSTDGPLALTSRFGISPGDVLLVAEPGQECTLMQVTSLPTGIGQNHLAVVSGSNYTVNGRSFNASYNKLGFDGILYGTTAKVGNLGRQPQMSSFYINNDNQLVQENLGNFNTGIQPVGDRVVAFKTEYALDTNNDGIVDSWSNITPSIENTYQIVGFRYALITKDTSVADDYQGECSTTTNSEFIWYGGTIDISSHADNWSCFRYRMTQGTVAFKNMLWSR